MTRCVNAWRQSRTAPSSSNGSLNGARGVTKSLETTPGPDVALQLRHPLLVTGRIGRLLSERPLEELVGVVWHEVGVQHAQSLSIVGHFGPVSLDVLQVVGQVREAALEDLTVHGCVQHGFEVDEQRPRFLGVLKHKVGGAFDGTHERADLVGVLCDERIVADVQDGAEAAAAEFGQLVDAQHLHIRLWAALRLKPFLELDHLHVLESNPGIDLAADDGFRHVHPAPHRRVVRGRHAIVRGQLVNLDLSKLADIADTFTLQCAEVGCDSGGLKVDHASEGLIEETSNGGDGEVAGFGLYIHSREESVPEKYELGNALVDSILTARV